MRQACSATEEMHAGRSAHPALHRAQGAVWGEDGPARCPLPLFLNPVAAGFPSPADDYVERSLDLNEYLVHNAAATFFVRAQGDSMQGAGIHDGDLLVVDRAIQPVHGRVVIAAVHGELTVKRLWMREGRTVLRPENPAYPVLDVSGLDDVELWGVVTSVIHRL